MAELSDNIRAAREKKGWSQETAARKLDVALVTWSRWETGRNSPSISMLQEVAELLGTTVSKLTKGI